MKKLLVSFLALTTILVVNAQQVVKTTEYFKGEKIAGLICDGSMNIQLNEDPSSTGVFIDLPEGSNTDITVDKTTEDYVRIKFGNDFNKVFKSKITIRVTLSKLSFMKLSGAVAVICKGKFMRSDDVIISMEGSSASSDYMDIVAKDVKIDLAGMTKMEEANISTTKFKLITSGTGPKVSIVGGKASAGTIETSGAGRSNINMVNFPIGKLEATITGLSLVKANVQTQAYVKVTNGASFRYMGLGVVEGSGNIKPL